MPSFSSMSALLLTALLSSGAVMTSHAQTPPAPAIAADATLLNVSVQGDARRVPDVATLSVGVVTESADGEAAMRSNAERMTAVMAAIKAAGIADRDVQTSGVNLSPQYQYRDREAPRITGYQASNTVNLKVRQIARLGQVMDALAGVGANQIHGPNFEIDQPEPVYDEARRLAVEQARARAGVYADALGLRVRRIVSITEGGGSFQPMPRMAMVKMAADSMESTPVAAGETTLSVHLDVVFELGR